MLIVPDLRAHMTSVYAVMVGSLEAQLSARFVQGICADAVCFGWIYRLVT